MFHGIKFHLDQNVGLEIIIPLTYTSFLFFETTSFHKQSSSVGTNMKTKYSCDTKLARSIFLVEQVI